MNLVIPDLSEIAKAMRRAPRIAAVRRNTPDSFIPRETWTVWLEGGYLADHAGIGDTINAAYQNAIERMETV